MAHVAAFGFLTFLLLRFARSAGFIIRWPLPVMIVLVVAGLGGLDEWVQSFTPGRTASPMDVLADVAGGLACILLTVFLPVAAKK